MSGHVTLSAIVVEGPAPHHRTQTVTLEPWSASEYRPGHHRIALSTDDGRTMLVFEADELRRAVKALWELVKPDDRAGRK